MASRPEAKGFMKLEDVKHFMEQAGVQNNVESDKLGEKCLYYLLKGSCIFHFGSEQKLIIVQDISNPAATSTSAVANI